MFKEWSAVPAHVAALGEPNRGHHYEEGRIQDNHGQHQKSPSDTEVISSNIIFRWPNVTTEN